MEASGFAGGISLLAGSPVLAITIHYVEPGNPSRYQTIQAAISAANATDEIHILEKSDGSPYEEGRLTFDNKNNIVVQAYVSPATGQRHDVVIDGNKSAVGAINFLIWVKANCSNITFKHLTIQDGKFGGIFSEADNVTVEECVFDDNSNFGFRSLGADSAKISSTLINCTFKNTVATSTGAKNGSGVRLSHNTNALISNCTSYNNNLDGIDIRKDCRHIEIYGCKSHDNGRQGLVVQNSYDILVHGPCRFYRNDATGIQLEGVPIVVGQDENGNDIIEDGLVELVEIKRAKCYDNNKYAAWGTKNEAGIWLDCVKDVLVEECDCYRNENGIRISTSGSTPNELIVVRYNQVYDNNSQNIVPGNVTPPSTHAKSWMNSSHQPAAGGLIVLDSRQVAIYNNTIVNNGGTYAAHPSGKLSLWGGVVVDANCVDISFFRNIVHDSKGQTSGSVQASQVRIGNGSVMKHMNDNLYFNPPGGDDYSVPTATSSSFADYRTEMMTFGHEAFSFEVDPQISFTLGNWYPDEFSIARNCGAPFCKLTSTASCAVYVDVPIWHFWYGDEITFDDGSVATVYDFETDTNGDDYLAVDTEPAASNHNKPAEIVDYLGPTPDVGAVEYIE